MRKVTKLLQNLGLMHCCLTYGTVKYVIRAVEYIHPSVEVLGMTLLLYLILEKGCLIDHSRLRTEIER